jgi:hypothetical protein
MVIGRVALGLRKHFQQMLDVWSARECVHRKITETIDSQGNIISRETTDTTIYAIIGNPPFDEKTQPIGAIQSGTLCLYYWYNNNDSDILVSKQLTPTTERHDQIDFQGTTYKVDNLDEIAYDLNTAGDDHEPIFAKYSLKKIAPT